MPWSQLEREQLSKSLRRLASSEGIYPAYPACGRSARGAAKFEWVTGMGHMRRQRVQIGAVGLALLCLTLTVSLTSAQSAPAIVKKVTPTPDKESVEIAKSLTQAKERDDENLAKEVLAENDQGQRPESGEPDFRSVNDLLAWSIAAQVQAGGNASAIHIGYDGANFSVLDSWMAVSERADGEVFNREAPDLLADLPALEDLMDVAEDSVKPTEVMREALQILSEGTKLDQDEQVERVTEALLTLEELCHNIDNANDLVRMDDVGVILDSLNHFSPEVRLNAALALATCMQNNPTAQRSLIQLNVVDRLMNLCVEDNHEGVRSRTLFALLCLAEFEEGRSLLEGDTRVVQILELSLRGQENSRMVRRALNMGEVLVRKGGDPWRSALVTVGMEAQRCLHESVDADVRESAAQFVKALYSVEN